MNGRMRTSAASPELHLGGWGAVLGMEPRPGACQAFALALSHAPAPSYIDSSGTRSNHVLPVINESIDSTPSFLPRNLNQHLILKQDTQNEVFMS